MSTTSDFDFLEDLWNLEDPFANENNFEGWNDEEESLDADEQKCIAFEEQERKALEKLVQQIKRMPIETETTVQERYGREPAPTLTKEYERSHTDLEQRIAILKLWIQKEETRWETETITPVRFRVSTRIKNHLSQVRHQLKKQWAKLHKNDHH